MFEHGAAKWQFKVGFLQKWLTSDRIVLETHLLIYCDNPLWERDPEYPYAGTYGIPKLARLTQIPDGEYMYIALSEDNGAR